METTSLTFVTGGVRSGKSSFAEKLAIEKACAIGGSLNYIATAQKYSVEMNERIAHHQRDRENSGFSWQTWEKENDIGTLSSFFQKKDVVLLDCLTVLLSNELDRHFEQLQREEIFNMIWSGIERVAASCHHLVLVSNEVLYEPYDSDTFMLTYYQLMGNLHQQIVSVAKDAYVVEAGIPILRKGDGK